jgi:hypothetical protein
MPQDIGALAILDGTALVDPAGELRIDAARCLCSRSSAVCAGESSRHRRRCARRGFTRPAPLGEPARATAGDLTWFQCPAVTTRFAHRSYHVARAAGVRRGSSPAGPTNGSDLGKTLNRLGGTRTALAICAVNWANMHFLKEHHVVL